MPDDTPAPEPRRILFRLHRGGFAESLATTIELADRSDPLGSLVNILQRDILGPSFRRGDVSVRPYVTDNRHADWEHTYIVGVSGSAVGYTNGPIVTPRDVYDDARDVLLRLGKTQLTRIRLRDHVLMIDGDLQEGTLTVYKRSSNWEVVVLETDRQTNEPRFGPDAFLVPIAKRRPAVPVQSEPPPWLAHLQDLVAEVRGEGTVGKAP